MIEAGKEYEVIYKRNNIILKLRLLKSNFYQLFNSFFLEEFLPEYKNVASIDDGYAAYNEDELKSLSEKLKQYTNFFNIEFNNVTLTNHMKVYMLLIKYKSNTFETLLNFFKLKGYIISIEEV